MDDQKRKHISGLEDENAFSDTLINDPDLADKQGDKPEAKDTEAKSARGKSGPKQPPWIGKIMGHFKLLRLIGTGAMGVVIQSEDTNLKRIVVLKVLRKQISAGQTGKKAVEQFLREARAAASIEHPILLGCMKLISMAAGGILRWKWLWETASRKSLKPQVCCPLHGLARLLPMPQPVYRRLMSLA